MYHEYSEFKRVYCIFPKTLSDEYGHMHLGKKQRGTLYKQTLEVDDCGQHMTFHTYVTEKTYFKIKLRGQHKARSHP